MGVEMASEINSKSNSHGNSGRTPWNATSEDIVRVYTRIIELNTRTDPSNRKLHLVADGELRGAAALVEKMRKGALNQAAVSELHDSTLRRFLIIVTCCTLA